MTDAIIKIKNLDRRMVYHHPVNGPTEQAFVTYVWPQMGKVPGVNLETLNTKKEHSSVPHLSAVPEASRGFWTWGPSSGSGGERMKLLDCKRIPCERYESL